MGFARISILGVGLIGGSVGLACRRHAAEIETTGYSPRPEDLRLAIARGAINQGTSDPAAAVAGAELVILCTPPGTFAKLMDAIAPALAVDAIVTDVGSTKRSVAVLAPRYLPAPARFVGSHPMAGGEKPGFANARADLLAGSLCIITPTDATDPSVVQRVEEFWQLLNMRTVRMTPEEHDRLTADISHLPHALAAAIVRIQSAQSLELAAQGFLDTTRIAAGDPDLWRDIFLENPDNLKSGIVRLQTELAKLLEHLDHGDEAAIREWLKMPAEVRRGLWSPSKSS